MRVVLFTGKGGVGKTTSSAATAVLAARRGHRTLVVSTDPAHSLADALGVPAGTVGPAPTPVAPGLEALQVDAQHQFEESWATVREYLVRLAREAGMDAVAAEEVVVPPGVDDMLALFEVRALAASGRWDVLVVDCAPTAETVRLLALPAVLGWYADRFSGTRRRLSGMVRPLLLREAADLMPGAAVAEAATRLREELAEVQAVLADPAVTTVRLVMTPEAVVLAEARRTFTALSLHGLAVDGVVVNRVIPDGADPWRSGWAAAQATQLAAARASFAGVGVRTVAYLPAEPIGVDALAAVGDALYGDDDPVAVGSAEPPLRLRTEDGRRVLSLFLPLVERPALDLVRVGDELVVTVGGQRRVIALPEALRRDTVAGARLAGDRLDVTFRPTGEADVSPQPQPSHQDGSATVLATEGAR